MLRIEESAAGTREHDSRGDSHSKTHGRAGERRLCAAGHWFGRIMSYSAERVNGCLSVSDILSGCLLFGSPDPAFSATYVLASRVPFVGREKELLQMEMLLMGACLSVFGLAVCCLAFGAATRDSGNAVAAAPAAEKEVVKAAVSPLLLQIENHVRLEHAAAECFLESPNASLLHSRTVSTLVN
jgi:hypothetical protein